MEEALITEALIKQLMSDAFWQSEDNLVLCSPDSTPAKEELQQWLEGQNELKAHVFFQTSGSTGSPKWVALAKQALLHSAKSANAHLGVKNNSKWLLSIPLYHVGGFGIAARAYASQGTVDLFAKRWNPHDFTSAIEEHGCQYSSLVPAQAVDLVRAMIHAPGSLKRIVVGGGHLNDEIYHAAIALGWPVVRSYGMSEAASQIATGDDGDYWLRVLPDWELALSSDGLLRWKGPAAFSGYLIKCEDGFSFEKALDENGWFTTQDEALLGDGKMKFVRRSGRTVKILGELVNLDSIEKELSSELQRDALTVTVPDERRGVSLYLVVEGDEAELPQKWQRGLTAISDTYTIGEFPRSPLGKILRPKVEEWFHNRFAGDK